MGVTQSQAMAASSAGQSAQVHPTDNTYRPTKTEQFSARHKRHVCIGINYSKTQSPLSACISDAQKMTNFIEGKKSSGIFMHDQRDPDSLLYPTRENILRALRWGMSSASIEDFLNPSVKDFPPMEPGTLCFFTYSGHGSSVADTNRDERDGRDEVICPVSKEGNFDTFIVDDTIGNIIHQRCRPSCNIVIVTDCCHSGTNSDLPFTIQGRRFVENGQYPQTSGPVFHIAGSRDTQYSYENGNGGYLTNAFLDCMKAPRLTLMTVHTRIRALVAQRVTANNQLPQLSTGHRASIGDRFPL